MGRLQISAIPLVAIGALAEDGARDLDRLLRRQVRRGPSEIGRRERVDRVEVIVSVGACRLEGAEQVAARRQHFPEQEGERVWRNHVRQQAGDHAGRLEGEELAEFLVVERELDGWRQSEYRFASFSIAQLSPWNLSVILEIITEESKSQTSHQATQTSVRIGVLVPVQHEKQLRKHDDVSKVES